MSYSWNDLDNLLLYRGILRDPLVQLLRSDAAEAEKTAALIKVAEELMLEGDIILEYLLHLLAEDENPFSIMAEKSGGQIGASLQQAAVRDIKQLRKFFQSNQALSIDDFLQNYQPTRSVSRSFINPLRIALNSPDAAGASLATLETFTDHYVRHGYGDMARYTVFRWDLELGLVPVRHPDRIQMDDLIGYERQKAVLTQNTEAFVAGRPANNVLLVGSRGTGKSSSVKALLNQYGATGLRLV